MSTQSYQLGKSIGKLAIFLKPDKEGNAPINSFETQYVGNLNRHIGGIRDVQKFCSYLFQKYALHNEKARYVPFEVRNGTVTKSIEDAMLLFQDPKNKIGYDKNECAFGFFSSYYAPFEAKKQEEIAQESINL